MRFVLEVELIFQQKKLFFETSVLFGISREFLTLRKFFIKVKWNLAWSVVSFPPVSSYTDLRSESLNRPPGLVSNKLIWYWGIIANQGAFYTRGLKAVTGRKSSGPRIRNRRVRIMGNSGYDWSENPIFPVAMWECMRVHMRGYMHMQMH